MSPAESPALFWRLTESDCSEVEMEEAHLFALRQRIPTWVGRRLCSSPDSFCLYPQLLRSGRLGCVGIRETHSEGRGAWS